MNTFFKAAAVLTAGLLALSFTAAAQKKAGIVAHRGYWNCEEAGYAKNSIAALKCAQEAGFWGSEFDVNMTSDGVLIVYHDSDIEGKLIEKYPYSEFKDYRIRNGETIPTIDQYLEQGKKHPETVLVYEMKPHSCPEVEDRFIDLAIANLEKHDLLHPKRVIFISFSFHICQELSKRLPRFTVQYLGGDKDPKEVKKAGIKGIDYHYKKFIKEDQWAKAARRKGMSTNAWTVNEKDDMKAMFKQKIRYLTTDYPVDAREVMKSMKMREL
jgi:glycerophosphoryl diester phosphodiesterase